ncbi:hypothetical protein QQF64_030146 [Cirrhinus molitorella]|uniref:Gypsy retrotransposon integrase-like protein 1 n=1 Tax=Cirrhinus molitorella TaxID=172907 RepID=A0ABR3N2I5_9TELE
MSRAGRKGAQRAVQMEAPEEEVETMEDGEEAIAEESGGQKPTLADLSSLFRAHMAQMDAREAKRAQEQKEQERRFKALQHQFGLLQMEVQARTTPTPDPLSVNSCPGEMQDGEHDSSQPLSQSKGSERGLHQMDYKGQFFPKEAKLDKLSDSDDIEHFLITFERIAAACGWPISDWAFRLIPLLTGKARAAYVQMDIKDALDYDSVKSAILRKYDINTETYRQRFRFLEVAPSESPKELYARLKELYVKWIRPEGKTVEEIGELIILEQYLRMLSPELQVWIRERGPETAAEAASLADVFVAARGRNQSWSWRGGKELRKPNVYHQSQYSTSGKPLIGGKLESVMSKPARKVPICYLCGQEGHTKPVCPKNVAKLSQVCFVPRTNVGPVKPGQALRMTTVEVNGKELRALVDTGSDQTLVHRRFVSPALINLADKKTICCVHGDEKLLPTADLFIKVQGQTYLLEVGVADNLPYPVILGHDLPVLLDLLQPGRLCNAVVTRAKKKQAEETMSTLNTLPFFDVDMEVEPSKPRKSRSERRREKLAYNASNVPANPVCDLFQSFQVPINIIQLQKGDISLALCFKKAQQEVTALEENPDLSERYLFQQGILYRQFESIKQLVVPQSVREVILKLSHSIPWAGHLGRYKTLARIKRHFYWPGLKRDVTQYCKSCPECQKVSMRTPSRAPLQSLPVINTPFERLGMDIIGPVERSQAGNRFMLVITDYATRYPEVFPMKSIKAKYVATCLIQLFSRVGFPCQILTDQGTNFMSTLLKQVYKLLGIESLRTTPFHPQTDGLTERFNQTFKQMLRKFIKGSGKDWDQWLPYLLFAYREVPQASTGFSPFELLYGRDVRGPLTLLRELWEGNPGGGDGVNVISYVLQMRERLEAMTKLAQAHMAEAQRHQKSWYDRSAGERSFSPGQKVLVMLPSHESKLLAKWQGPFEIKRKLGPTTYEIATPNLGRCTKVLHINLLKEWIPCSEKSQVLMVQQVAEEEELEEQYLPQPITASVDLDHLSKDRQAQVRALCHPNIFSEYPGATTLIEHEIVLKSDAAVKRMSYRIPERLQESLRKEIDLMLTLRIIEPSKSEWCHPVVLVPKKDGTLRFCIDFRYLNSVSKFDSYPTPRISDLIDRVGQSEYLTTIDLAKGYWQIPLTSQSRELTAFRTPWGLFHFRVLPFGLHGAPATFQRLIDQILNGLSFAAAYLDDIVIYSDTWEQHLQHLQEVQEGIKIIPWDGRFL